MKKKRAIDKTEKYCPDCEETKPVQEFYASRIRCDGRAPYCKECSAKRARSRNTKVTRSKNKNSVESYINWVMHGLKPNDFT